MKQIRALAQYYVDLMVRLGLIRFSILLATVLVFLAIAVEMMVTLLLRGHVNIDDIIRSVFFALLITPWSVYFLSVVVDQLEASRQRLLRLVEKLKEMRLRDQELNERLHSNIVQLNQEIEERVRAEQARLEMVEKLEKEVAQREAAQIKSEQNAVLLRSFMDASPDLIFYRDDQHRFSGCNRAAELLLGKSEQEVIGMTPHDVYREDAAEKVLETDEHVLRHNVSLTYEQWFEYPDGRKACFEIRKVPFYDMAGKQHGLVAFGRDITERKRYQDALEKASREKTTFISTISHELRTPLNGIVGLSRILMDTELNNEQLNYLKTIYVSAITLGNIFNDIIDMDKIERRNVQLDKQVIDFNEFLTDLQNLAGLLVQPKGLAFVLETQPTLPAKILTDGTRLRQILWNLIGNAVKFTQQGAVTVRVWQEADDQICFDVEDTGIGIPKEEQDKIFAMYYQVKDKNGGKPATGTGIGLAVSQRLAQSMGGGIRVRSELGKGTCFTLTIFAPAVGEEKADQPVTAPDALPALHVLLVEDIELNVVVARSVLEKLGCTVDVAMNGHDALAMFDPAKYDLALLDIQLPDMTGLDIARQLRERYAAHTLPPLIALTANVLKDKQEYLKAGMDDVLSKPLAVKALTDVIRQRCRPPVTSSTHLIREPAMTTNYSALLDLPMLEQYIDLVGPQLITQSLDMFENLMPGYLAVLESNMTARDQQGIRDEGHKIKGAAGSVGLKRLQQLAQQIQSPELPAWWDNVQDWIDELNQEWRNDVQILRDWIKEREQHSASA